MESNAISKQIKYEVIDMADRVDRMETMMQAQEKM